MEKKILESFNDEFVLDTEQSEFIEHHPELAKIQLSKEFQLLNSSYNPRQIDAIFELAGQVSNDDFYNHLLRETFAFYLLKIQNMIEMTYYFSIYTLLDLFRNNETVFDDSIEKNVLFMHRTYPILLIESAPPEKSSSFIFNAGCIFLSFLNHNALFNNSNINVLEKFKLENNPKYLHMTKGPEYLY